MKYLGTGRYLGTLEPGTDEWTAARAARIGGSEIAAILGLSPWESYFSLWHRKKGLIGPVAETDLMWWGKANEPACAARFAYLHPEWEVRRIGTYVNRERDYQLISPDRLLMRPGGGRWSLLEIKQAHDGGAYADDDGELISEWGPDGTDQIPVYYRCQVLWAMDTLGVTEHRLVAYFGGDDFREYLVQYDEAEALILRKRAEEFIDALACDRRPSLDAHTATYHAVQELHPEIDDVDRDTPTELAEQYLSALQAVRDADERKALATVELADWLGSDRRAIHGENAKGKPRSIACRIPGRNGGPPYLRASPLPKPKKEIA